MPGLRVMLRATVAALCLPALFAFPSAPAAQPPRASQAAPNAQPGRPSPDAPAAQPAQVVQPAPADTARPAKATAPAPTSAPDTARALGSKGGFAETLRKADSATRVAQDTLLARAGQRDTAVKADSAKRARKTYRWESPYPASSPCPAAPEAAYDCWRTEPYLANQNIGFPGARSWTLSTTRQEPAPLESPFFPGYRNSPYGDGGLLPPENYALRKVGLDVRALEDVWAPVLPLDTPVTIVDWERGAFSLNVFRLRLRRMLSEDVYLGLDYYSTTADSQEYAYQFNVHQPYLSGWGFLGKIYPPIDRDSASLVITGVSQNLDASNFRPRVGFWLDTAQVLEVFLDRVRNHSDLVWPGPRGATAVLGPADSTQIPMPSSLSAWTGGAILGSTGRGWSSQLEASSTSLEKTTPRVVDTAVSALAGARADGWEGTLQRLRGRAAAPGLPLSPWLEAEARSETWQGDLFLSGAGGGIAEEGWLDAEAVTLGLRPAIGGLVLEGSAGIGRSSRMDARESWLPRFGASAELELPLGLRAEAGAAYERRDPDWELLYRHNPALYRYPSPGLDPRADADLRGSLAWELPYVRLGGGAGYAVSEDAWLPAVLPDPNVCVDAQDAYAGVPGAACAGGKLPDSLALRLENWDRLRRFDWHLALGLELGNWSLDLRNLFLVEASAEDGAVRGSRPVPMFPARVFKGHLGWDRLLVDGKLRATVGWGWEWFSTRYAWVPDLQGRSQARKLDEYLALDFRASMKIRTFLLYFKGMNFNHDRYAIEPGSHPPGINFRYGIEWTLWN